MISWLSAERKGMERAMLEAVAANEVGRNEDIDRYLKCTLLNATTDVPEVGQLWHCSAPHRSSASAADAHLLLSSHTQQ